MEWTGARYADKPIVEVETFIEASPEQIWALVADVEQMPSMSSELQRIEWQDGATGPSVGATFVGYSKHPALGEWNSTSTVLEYDEPKVFTWAVMADDVPSATWRFTLEPGDGGTTLRQWMRMGPGRSGLSFAIDRMPEKEQKIVFVRLREFEASMTATVAAIKERVESAAAAL
ncbi:SRPBCC family protein [Pseudonocardia spinosispora]|uniref:SRPBCC family protein n=1 Tax=Pseudonocardia spinosispora TaxID=103441 RepID=UPI00041D9B80|nr:SRPBCC family protein [Pseudonocardia spinosispora]